MRISRRCERLHYWLFRPFLAQYYLLISGRIPSSRTRGSLVYPEYNAQAQAFFIANPARRYYVKFSDVETDHSPILLVYRNPGRIGDSILDPLALPPPTLPWRPQGGERSCLAVEDGLKQRSAGRRLPRRIDCRLSVSCDSLLSPFHHGTATVTRWWTCTAHR